MATEPLPDGWSAVSQGRGTVHPVEDKDLGLWGGKGQTAIGWELLRELENCAE